MSSIIYVIWNGKTNKMYVGATKSPLNRRMSSHFCEAKAGNKAPLYESIRRHGKDSIFKTIVEFCKDQERHEREKFWIYRLSTTWPLGYNIRRAPRSNRRSNERHQAVILFNKNTKTETYFKSSSDVARHIGCAISLISRSLYSNATIKGQYLVKKPEATCTFQEIQSSIESRKTEVLEKFKTRMKKLGPWNKGLKTNAIALNAKKIEGTNLETKEVVIFDSLRLAAKHISGSEGTLSMVCRGLRKTHKGWSFRCIAHGSMTGGL